MATCGSNTTTLGSSSQGGKGKSLRSVVENSSNNLILYAEKRLHELVEHFHPARKKQKTVQVNKQEDGLRKDIEQDHLMKCRKAREAKVAKNVGPMKKLERKSEAELLQLALKDMNFKRFNHMYKQFLLKRNSPLVIRSIPKKEKKRIKEIQKDKNEKEQETSKKDNSGEVETRNLKKKKNINDSPSTLASTSSTNLLLPERAKVNLKRKYRESKELANHENGHSQTEEEVITTPTYGYVANYQIHIYHVFRVVVSLGGCEILNRQPYFKLWANVADHKLIGLPKGKVSIAQSRGQKLQDFFYRYELDLFCKWLCGLTERSLQSP